MNAGKHNKISLIIPVYNVGKYLRQCLDSVIQQTYQDYEIILIDDGSTDNSYQICAEYSSVYNNVHLLHKENGGLTSAWQCGLDASDGEYITFLDSDDWVEPDYIERLSVGIEMGADVVCCNKMLEYGNYSVFQREQVAPGYYSQNELLKSIFPRILNDGTYLGRCITPHRCGKLFKRILLTDNTKYCDKSISFGEDLNIVLPVLMDCRALLVLEDETGLYHYRQNRSSISRSYKNNMYEQISRLYTCFIRATAEKTGFDFKMQLDADFFCLFFEYVKNETKCKDKKKFVVKKVLDNYRRMRDYIDYNFVKNIKLKFSDKILFFCLENNMSAGIYLWFILYSTAKMALGEVDWKYLFTRKIKKKSVSGF